MSLSRTELRTNNNAYTSDPETNNINYLHCIPTINTRLTVDLHAKIDRLYI